MTWSYDYKCLSCSEQYSVTFDTIHIGPIGMSQIVGSAQEHPDAITRLETKPLYDGEILQVMCSCCHFACHICIDLDRFAMSRFVQLARLDWPDYDIDRYFENQGQKFVGFPLKCLACEEEIERAGQWKKCKFCGSKQLNIIRSERIR